MKLIAGTELDPKRYFTGSYPTAQASSFDLSIGCIYDETGTEVPRFNLKPGHMVQVVSKEIFNLPANTTGHVTYKTTLTQEGIWALTVGIVDPGWNGPIATTLLNFSKVEHTIHQGDKFLRVSLFEHEAVGANLMRKAPELEVYRKQVQSRASSRFPHTFMNHDLIAEQAGKKVMSRIRVEALAWIGLSAILFTVIQVFAPPAADAVRNWGAPSINEELLSTVTILEERIKTLEAELSSGSARTETPAVVEEPDVPETSEPAVEGGVDGTPSP
ncbi:hypothetical protein [Devosia sp. MC1541]|uniref:dCTP deaminase domain-containing protein n=1 Tax=Devosia sp. MC1541 TaxID=2725264 RepID=UPI00145D38C0|nr:hypothetical protein [Devosia sp. MC1541]